MNKKIQGIRSKTKKAQERMIHFQVTISRIKDIRRDDRSLSLVEAVEFVEKWCEENTTGIWSKDGLTLYYFEEESDAMAFKLMWC